VSQQFIALVDSRIAAAAAEDEADEWRDKMKSMEEVRIHMCSILGAA
jgi:hypothetical protein